MDQGKEPIVGAVHAEIEVTNMYDEQMARVGTLQESAVRKAKLTALVDTGAFMLVLPEPVIGQLGLPEIRKTRSRVADGRVVERSVYGGVKLRVFKRIAQVEAIAGSPEVPALLGQIPLEVLDMLVDAKRQQLVLNPASPDPEMPLYDLY